MKAAEVAGAVRRGFHRRRRAPAGARPDRRDPLLKRQQRLTFARCGIIDPLSIDDYRAHGGFAGSSARSRMRPADDRRGSRSTPACAAAAARRSRPASSGGPCTARGASEVHHLQRRRGRLAAPSPTAC